MTIIKYFTNYTLYCLVALIVVCCSSHNNKPKISQTNKNTVIDDTISLPIQLKIKKFTIQDGLPSNSIASIFQDSKGFLWCGTHNGLARYDGIRFTIFRKDEKSNALDENRVKGIKEDASNLKMWLYTASENFSCLDLKTGHTIDYLNGSVKPHFIHSKIITDGEIWMYGKKAGAMRVLEENNQFSTQYFSKANIGSDKIVMFDTISVKKIVIGTPNALFLYTAKGLKCIYKGKSFVKTQCVNKRQMFLTDDGCLFELINDKLHLVNKISWSSGELYKDDLVYKDKWVIFTSIGGYVFDLSKNVSSRCSGDWDIKNGNVITDNKGRKWIYNKTGILRFISDKGIVCLNMLPQDETNYIDYERYHIVEDNLGLIWISTYGNGLFVFSHDLKQQQHFIAEENEESPIASNYLLDMIVDSNDGIWVSADFGGLSHIQVIDKSTERIFPNESKKMDFSNVVRMISKSPNGDVLVSTRNGWLYRYSADMKRMVSKTHYDSNVYAVNESESGEVWIGTRGKGIHGVAGLTFEGKNVFCMTKDHKKRMWIGTYGNGLSVAEKNNNKYSVKTMFADSVATNEVRCMKTDARGWIWIGTTGGLLVFNPDIFINHNDSYYMYLNGVEIHDLIIDSDGNVWFATPGEGISMAENPGDYANLQFKHFDHSDGLINNMTQSIVEDKDKNFWITTQQGVSHFNKRKGTFDNYCLDANHMGNVYNENSAVCLNDGRLLLGGYYGLTLINPNKLHHSKGKVNVVFTSHPYTDNLTLDNKNNSPIIDFSTLDYSDVNNVKYSCWLEGLDEDWSIPSPASSVTFRNLPSGTYTLHAKACNADGLWGNESVLTIVVKPPFYLSFWALVLYLVIITFITIVVLKNIREKNDLRNKVNVEKELTKYKLSFFTNIAHEFRTPLTLIQCSLEQENKIVKANGWHGELDKSIKTMNKSVRRMLRLIDQLLEFRKMQAGKLALALQETDMVAFIKSLCQTFDDVAESKKISYNFDSSENAYVMYIDRQNIDKVVFNLLSNAFKYTPSGGNISVRLSFDDVVTIKVSDTGVGIPLNKRGELFSRFMQSAYTGESFGIGLHLTKELVTVHHGSITYEENEGGGSVFVVKIPIKTDAYSEKDFLLKNNPIFEDVVLNEDNGDVENESVVGKNITPLNKKKILLVEDDNDVRDFLASELNNYFEVVTETDGKSGLAKAKEYDADLIISDVMMPEMNGFELTKRLRNNFETSHIPIILLTALSNEENQLEGTESGADAYITKPFSPQLLVARIFQLLEGREKIKQKFSQNVGSIRSSLCSTEQDQVFVRRLDAVIMSKLSDQTLSVEKVAEMLHLGRTIFYRKVKGITGYTPNEYIRVKRLKQAADLLKSGQMNVSQVAYEVGFDNPYYFSKCFKDQFGIPPSQYRE